jgi:hypothetical protein
MDFTRKHNGFSFLSSLFSGEKPLIPAEPPIGFEPMTCRLRIGCTANCATVAYFVSGGDYKGNHINPQGNSAQNNFLLLQRGCFGHRNLGSKFFRVRVV